MQIGHGNGESVFAARQRGDAASRGAARTVVFSSIFPHAARPQLGVFVRERAFRVARHRTIVVVAPVAWFPFQSLLRWIRPGFRPPAVRSETVDGIEIHRPRFVSVPGLFKRLDGWLMAAACVRLMRRLQREQAIDVIDAHFAYPDGYAATRLGCWLAVPVAVTMRGSEVRYLEHRAIGARVARALRDATWVFAVSASLARVAADVGVEPAKIEVVRNGVDRDVFRPRDRREARAKLGLPARADVLISVGGLVERKGIHRVLEVLPALRRTNPTIHYLVAGGPGPEGDWRARLEAIVAEKGLEDCVTFLGEVEHGQLSWPLSASDVFVLPTTNEGCPNAVLEAMSCGLPIVTTRVGGNPEIVTDASLGTLIVPRDRSALEVAVAAALGRRWDRDRIIAHASAHSWDRCSARIADRFDSIAAAHREATAT